MPLPESICDENGEVGEFMRDLMEEYAEESGKAKVFASSIGDSYRNAVGEVMQCICREVKPALRPECSGSVHSFVSERSIIAIILFMVIVIVSFM